MKEVTGRLTKEVGAKAYNLQMMKNGGLPVPDFAIFSFDIFQEADSRELLKEKAKAYAEGQLDLQGLSLVLQEEFRKKFQLEDLSPIEEFVSRSQEGVVFAVRSSANLEDDASASFAGQFKTSLFVEQKDLVKAIEQTLLSLYQTAALSYYEQHDFPLDSIHLHVVLQEMVSGDVSGVYFTANPQGILNEHVIVVGYGDGSGIVEDKVETTMVTLHPDEGISYFEIKGSSPRLSRQEEMDLVEMAQQVTLLFGPMMDIEFTFCQGQLYVLQARPITKMSHQALFVLDNSNIVESYPGITSPLSFSFIQEAYSGIFKGLAKRILPHDPKSLEAFQDTLEQMIAQVNGRVYYQISNWYQVLQLAPFSKKLIPIWQDMLGVETKDWQVPKIKLGLTSRLRIMGSLLKYFVKAPRLMEQLQRDFEESFDYFHQHYHQDASFEDLHHLFEQVKNRVLLEWDITLVNDLYAFVYTGLLKKWTSEKEVQAQIAGIEQIESMKPVLALDRIVELLQEESNREYRQHLLESSPQAAAAWLEIDQDKISQEIRHFLILYGDRAPQELKLETKTFRSHPYTLVSLLQERLSLQLDQEATSPRSQVSKGKESNSGNPIIKAIQKRALLGIKYRESSRLNRTRIYGMMRLIFLAMGKRLVERGTMDKVEDVFYLSMTEVFDLSQEDKARDMSPEISKRKYKAAVDQTLPAYRRLVFAGNIFEKYPQVTIQQESLASDQKEFQGIGCSQGLVRGQALVVEDVSSVSLEESIGKIIVTKMTDPGWVYLLMQAKGIVAEQGSLLSHTAIISRELGIPSIVNLKKATQDLKTGDWLEMDGQTGLIRRLEEKENDT